MQYGLVGNRNARPDDECLNTDRCLSIGDARSKIRALGGNDSLQWLHRWFCQPDRGLRLGAVRSRG